MTIPPLRITRGARMSYDLPVNSTPHATLSASVYEPVVGKSPVAYDPVLTTLAIVGTLIAVVFIATALGLMVAERRRK